MGAIGCEREPGQSNRDFFAAECLGTDREIIDCATVPTSGEWSAVFYAAVKDADGTVWALVVPHGRYRGMFHYKPLDETVGPAEDTCPLRILDRLSPTDSEWAQEWRERCRTYAANLAALEAGELVRFDADYLTPEGPCREFCCEDPRRGRFRSAFGTVYTLRGWRGTPFEPVNAA